jgi:regulator of protease activity HflC (stomatin/prohibitin superfamily)
VQGKNDNNGGVIYSAKLKGKNKMKAILIITFVALMLASLGVGTLAVWKKYKQKHKKYTLPITLGLVGFAISLAGMLLYPCGLYTVQSGEVAVVKQFGEIKTVETAGMRYRNIFTQTYEIFDIKTRELAVEKEAYSSDLQAVIVNQVIQFTIQAENVKQIATVYGSLSVLEQRIEAIALEAIEEAAKDFEAKDLVVRRNEFNQAIKDNIGGKFTNYFIDIRQTVLSNIVFTPEFEQMIQQTKLLEQEIEKSRQELEKQLQEAEYKVRIAKQEAEERIAQATGQADAQRALAQAEADKIEMLAIAEAQAIIEKAEALALLSQEDKAYLEIIALIEAWDGALPEVLAGDIAAILQSINGAG